MRRSEVRCLAWEHGRNAGSWVVDGDTSPARMREILTGYEDGDPMVLDLQPSPLSGEWADEPTPQSLGLTDDQCDVYEFAFGEAFWAEVVRSIKASLPDGGRS
jgi:hypothetical protein